MTASISICGTAILSRPEPIERPEDLPDLPKNGDGPVFRAPWEAQAFAMAVQLHEKGVFTWSQWSAALAREIAKARERGGDTGEDYYLIWLRTLELIVEHKGIVDPRERSVRQDAWDRAARATPHGEPIVLGRDEITE